MPDANPERAGRVGNAVGIAILARAPIAGLVKTRLIPLLGAEGAARLQAWLLQRTVVSALAADVGPVTLWCDGDLRHADFALCHSFAHVTVRQQPQVNLGLRMLTALQESPNTSPNSTGTLVIGTDCPARTAAHLRLAAQCLQDHDAVFLPAEDGGYVLVGMQTPEPHVFDHVDWGSDQVMTQTRQRLADLGWHWAEPLTLWDIDRPTDFTRLTAMIPDLCRELGLQPNSP